MKHFAVVAALLFLSSFKTPDEKFVSKKNHFSLEVPEGYLVQKGISDIVIVMMVAPAENPEDTFSESINVVAEKFNGSADEYFTAASKVMKNAMKNFEIGERGNKTVNGLQQKWFTYTFTYGEKNIKCLVALYVIKGKACIITCGASPETYERYVATFRRVCDSMKKI